MRCGKCSRSPKHIKARIGDFDGPVCTNCYQKWRYATVPGLKEAYSLRRAKKYLENPTPARTASLLLSRERPAKKMLVAAKGRAKKRGLEFDLKETDIVVPATCPVLGIPIQVGNSRLGPHSPSLDRIDNSKGYER